MVLLCQCSESFQEVAFRILHCYLHLHCRLCGCCKYCPCGRYWRCCECCLCVVDMFSSFEMLANKEPTTLDHKLGLERKSCNNACKWSCTTLLTLSVAIVHILVSTSIASVSSDMTTILLAIAAITINVFLCYGAICSRKESLITWLAFYGILLFIAMSCITPTHLKVSWMKSMQRTSTSFFVMY